MKKNIIFSNIFILIISLCIGYSCVAQSTKTDSTKKQEPRGRIWGYVFGDFFWKAGGDTLNWGKYEYAAAKKGTIGGRLRRLYLGYDYKISDAFSSHVLMEVNEGTTTKEGKFSFSIKTGYIEWKNPLKIPNSRLRGGLVPTPVFAIPEKTWGYRSVEKEALDLRGFSSSVDQGASFDIDFNNKKNGGITLMAGNGTGNKPGASKNLEYYASIYKKLLNNKLTLELLGNYKKTNDSTDRALTRFFVSYELKKFRFGAEISEAWNDELVSGKTKAVKPVIFSVFSSYGLPVKKDNLALFVRYDYFNPDKEYNKTGNYSSASENYNERTFMFGFQYAMDKKVLMMPNMSINTYSNKKDNLVARKADIIPRITLYWLFGD